MPQIGVWGLPPKKYVFHRASIQAHLFCLLAGKSFLYAITTFKVQWRNFVCVWGGGGWRGVLSRLNCGMIAMTTESAI